MVSSGVLFMFWFLLAILAIPQFRQEIRSFQDRENGFEYGEISWEDYLFLSNMIYFPIICIQLFLHCVADQKPLNSKFKQSKSNEKTKNPVPEIFSSYLRKITFMWFDIMTWRGFRKPLVEEDMWDINPQNASIEIAPSFDKHWKRSVEKNINKVPKAEKVDNKGATKEFIRNVKSTNGSVVSVLFSAFGGPFYFAGVLKLFIDLLSFANPQLLK